MSEAIRSIPPTELRGIELLRWTINQILAHPDQWDQNRWHCHSSHCFLGWVEIGLMGGCAVDDHVGFSEDADLIVADVHSLGLGMTDKLGLTDAELGWLVSCVRTLRDLWLFCRAKIARPGEVLISPGDHSRFVSDQSLRDDLRNDDTMLPYPPL